MICFCHCLIIMEDLDSDILEVRVLNRKSQICIIKINLNRTEVVPPLFFCRSVVVSLRLLPKLFASFQNLRGGSMDTHHVTMWALKEHTMMERFFDNLRCCSATGRLPLTHVQVRLQFLTHIYSPLGLPECIR